jgi:hypothetical protein
MNGPDRYHKWMQIILPRPLRLFIDLSIAIVAIIGYAVTAFKLDGRAVVAQ